MAQNKLSADIPRLGWFIDGNPNTPEVAVMLQDTGSQVVLTVPTKGMFDHQDRYSRWFAAGVHFGDDPDRTKYSYRPPRVTMFHDNDGVVVLVGCRAIGMSAGMTAGHGRIVANFAVLGGNHLRYEKVNGVRSALPALSAWTGLSSVAEKALRDGQGKVQQVQVTLNAPPSIPLDRHMNLALRPTWRRSLGDSVGTFATHDLVELTTSTQRPRTWEDHLRSHVAIRDLLVLSAWHPFGFSELTVNREDDPERVMSGEPIGPRWSQVVTHRLPKHEAWKNAPRFLFTFQDIGVRGVRRWMKVRTHFERAMQPLLAIADQRSSYWETRMVLSGIAIESLGYQIEVDRGGSNLDPRGQLSYGKAMQTILDDTIYVPLPNPDDWKSRSGLCYRSVKHPDNPPPDSLTLANTLRENLLVLRYWLAGRLGCKKAVLQGRLTSDPHSQAYRLAD